VNKFFGMVAFAAAILPSAAIFAQTSQQPLTRAQVRAELVELERAGYNPASANDPNYPADIEAAEAKVAAEHAANGQAVGGISQGTGESGGGAPAAR
jgi:hypothetical protein